MRLRPQVDHVLAKLQGHVVVAGRRAISVAVRDHDALDAGARERRADGLLPLAVRVHHLEHAHLRQLHRRGGADVLERERLARDEAQRAGEPEADVQL